MRDGVSRQLEVYRWEWGLGIWDWGLGRNKGEADVVGRGERIESVAATVDEASSGAQIASGESGTDTLFVSLEKAGQQSGSDAGNVGEIGIFEELIAQSDGGAVQSVVGAASELDKAAAFEALAVGRAAIAEVGAGVVQVERMAAGGCVETTLAFADGEERSSLSRDGGERHQDHRLIGERGGDQRFENERKIRLDIGTRGERNHSRGDVDSDIGNQREEAHRLSLSSLLAGD